MLMKPPKSPIFQRMPSFVLGLWRFLFPRRNRQIPTKGWLRWNMAIPSMELGEKSPQIAIFQRMNVYLELPKPSFL